jgi:predicted nuclease of predicted toxin-antitoxin system
VQILADENIRRALVDALRTQGHDVVWVAEVAPQSADPSVFDLAVQQGRVLLTGDLDFADIVYRQNRRGLKGLILVRIDLPDLDEFLRSLLEVWDTVATWEGVTTVLEVGRYRQRDLPG